jgi:hypothetical protein
MTLRLVLLLWLRKSGTVPLLPPHDLMAYTGTALPLPFGTVLPNYIVARF